jgi:hypothetical protein
MSRISRGRIPDMPGQNAFSGSRHFTRPIAPSPAMRRCRIIELTQITRPSEGEGRECRQLALPRLPYRTPWVP